MQCMPCIAGNKQSNDQEIKYWNSMTQPSPEEEVMQFTCNMLGDKSVRCRCGKHGKCTCTWLSQSRDSSTVTLGKSGQTCKIKWRIIPPHTMQNHHFVSVSLYQNMLVYVPMFPWPFLPSPTQCHHWCFRAIWWRHPLLYLSQRQGSLFHCLRWLDPGITIHTTL